MPTRVALGRAAVITVSDSLSQGTRASDESGDSADAALRALGLDIVSRDHVGDTRKAIATAVTRIAGGVDVVVLTGGTGLGPRDVTPQALNDVIDVDIPGMAEAMRAAGMRSTPMAMLSRQRAGITGNTLVLALPGSPRAVTESLEAVADALPHALALIRGNTEH